MNERRPGPFITAGRLLWQNADAVIRVNALWFALTVSIVAAPQALAGLYTYTHKLAQEEAFPTLDDFWRGFRTLAAPARRWALLNLAALAILAGNLLFYGQIETTAGRTLFWFWAVASANWLLLQGYVFPLLLLQEQPRIRTALRNALVIAIRHPLRTVLHAALTVAIVVLSTAALLPWVLFTGAALALVSDQTVVHSVRLTLEKRQAT